MRVRERERERESEVLTMRKTVLSSVFKKEIKRVICSLMDRKFERVRGRK